MPPKKSTPVAKKPSSTASKAAAPKPVRKAAAAKPAAKPAEKTAAKPEEKTEPEKPAKHMTIGSKQIAKILIEDDDREIRNEKKGVLVIDDENGIACRFLPYSGANVLEAINPGHMDAERIRLAVMGAVRFGKPIALDLGACDHGMVDALKQRFDLVQKGLFDKCMNRQVCTRAVYESLMKEGDDATFKVESYVGMEEDVSEKFIFMLVMKSAVYPKEFTNNFYTVTVE